jgi:hypothetical protein
MKIDEDTSVEGLLESIRGSLADLSQAEPDLRSYRDWKARLESLAESLEHDVRQAKRWASFKQ